MNRPERILITGAGRGLGLEFARQWLAAGKEVCALAREPEKSRGLASLRSDYAETLRVAPCDVADDASVESARKEISGAWDSLDLLLNNAGIYGPRDGTLQSVKLDEIRRVFEVNTLGPIRVTRAFMPLLRKGSRPRVVLMTSLMGSIGDNGSGGSWPYRISKTALNMVGRNLALELREDGIPAIVIHPGWVRTDMGGKSAPLSIEESVSAMVSTIGGLTPERTGMFLDRNGEPLPW